MLPFSEGEPGSLGIVICLPNVHTFIGLRIQPWLCFSSWGASLGLARFGPIFVLKSSMVGGASNNDAASWFECWICSARFFLLFHVHTARHDHLQTPNGSWCMIWWVGTGNIRCLLSFLCIYIYRYIPIIKYINICCAYSFLSLICQSSQDFKLHEASVS